MRLRLPVCISCSCPKSNEMSTNRLQRSTACAPASRHTLLAHSAASSHIVVLSHPHIPPPPASPLARSSRLVESLSITKSLDSPRCFSICVLGTLAKSHIEQMGRGEMTHLGQFRMSRVQYDFHLCIFRDQSSLWEQEQFAHDVCVLRYCEALWRQGGLGWSVYFAWARDVSWVLEASA